MGEIAVHQDNFIIGLTGNIGTGKSLVRKMLQHLGAYGIDADILTHEALKPDGPAKDQIVHRFGSSILDSQAAVDRVKLARIVFDDEKALAELENILHPFVSIAAGNMIKRARLPIVIIEAIKLLDSDLADMCDSIWVVDAQEQVVFDRLTNEREMGRAEIEKRLSHQSPSKDKQQQADMVIENSQEVHQTWLQVAQAWDQIEKENRDFSNCIKRTSDLLAFLDSFLITPSSQNFTNIKDSLFKGDQSTQQFIWFEDSHPVRKKHASEDFIWHICQYILFAIPDSFDNQNITIWDMSQFEFTLLGHSHPDSDAVTQGFKKMNVAIEQFSRMHMIKQIVFPIEDALKERQSFLRESGYMLLPPGGKDVSYWNKAGYNLYKRKVCDAFDLFSMQT
jgi:dephospho-CoA kinase